MKKILFTFYGLLLVLLTNAQNVGIGTSTPIQKLDVIGNIRSSTLTGIGNRFVTADPTGTLNISSAGFLDSTFWKITGNTNTTAGTNFIGTIDAKDFVLKTGGSAAANERMRILSAGPISMNCLSTQAGDVLGVYAKGYPGAINAANTFAINGYVRDSSGAGIYAENQAALGAAGFNSFAIWGLSNNTGGGTGVFGQAVGGVNGTNGIWGQYSGTAAAGIGVRGQSGTGDASAVAGFSSGVLAIGVFGQNTGAAGTGILGFANAGGDGVFGQATTVAGYAGWFVNNAATNNGNAVVASGGTSPSFTLTGTGVGGSFSGRRIGLAAFVGVDSSLATATPSAGGYFVCNASNYSYVAARISSTNYKIIGPGTVSTLVKDASNQQRIMYAPETPEVLLQDYGNATLVNGQAHVELDPIFARNILVNIDHPLKVFVQLNGDCNGVYVLNRTSSSFDVKELSNGTSNVEFTYTVVGNRADEVSGGVVVSKYANNRFEVFKGHDSPTLKSADKKLLKEARPELVPSQKK